MASTTRKPPTEPVDALADVRGSWGTPDDAAPVLEALGTEPDPDEDLPDPVLAVALAWHADQTAASVVHRGGTCACRYLAERALKAVDAARGLE